MRNWRRGSVLFLVAVLGGCHAPIIEWSIERRLKSQLPSLIGPAESYHVAIQGGSRLSLADGRLRAVQITGQHVLVGGQWPVDRLQILLEEVHVNVRQRRIEKVEASHFQARLSPSTFRRYIALEAALQNVRDAQVLLKEGRVVLRGRYYLARVWVPFEIWGSLFVQDRTSIGFRSEQARAGTLPVPQVLLHAIERRLNPVFNVARVQIPITLTSIEVRPDGVTISGVVHVEKQSLQSVAWSTSQ